MKKSILFLAGAVGLIAASCQNFKKGDGGLEYKIVKDEGAAKAGAGDHMFYDMVVLSDRNDSLIQSTYDLGLPEYIQVPADSIPGTYKGDFTSMFRMLGEGDSAVFRLNLDTMAAKTGQPKPPIADHYITFQIKVRKHVQKGNLQDSVVYAELDKFYKGEIEKLEKGEPAKIEKYVSSNKLQPKKTASNLQYVVETEGKGDKAVLGDTVVVNYTGRLINGKVFDSSVKEVFEKEKLPINPMKTFEPFRLALGSQPVIPGWVEGIQLLNKGAKAKFIIPSALGYGPNGNPQGRIAPYSPLIFDIEVVDIIKGKAPEAAPAPEVAPAPAN